MRATLGAAIESNLHVGDARRDTCVPSSCALPQARPVRLFLGLRCRQQVSEFMLKATNSTQARNKQQQTARLVVCVRKKKHENQHLKNRKKTICEVRERSGYCVTAGRISYDLLTLRDTLKPLCD